MVKLIKNPFFIISSFFKLYFIFFILYFLHFFSIKKIFFILQAKKMFKKIASNTITQILSKVWTATISIFLLSFLTNYLSVELFWLYNKMYNYLGIFSFLADLWLYTITIREISNHPEKTEKIVGNVLGLRLILWIIIIFLALWIGVFLPWYNTILALSSIFIVSLFTLFWLFNSSILALMQAKMRIEFNLISTVLGKLFTLVSVIFIVFVFFPWVKQTSFFLPFLCIMLAGLLWVIVHTSLNYFFASRLVRIRFLFEKDMMWYLFKISLPYWLALFLSVVYFKVDIILLSLLEPKGIADTSIALYSLPMKIIEVLMILIGFYLNAILPILSQYFEKKNVQKAKQLLSFSFEILFSFGLIIFTLGVFFRKTIILLVANEKYLDPSLVYNASDAFFIVLASVVFYSISSLFSYIFIASGNQARLLKINAWITLFNIVWNIFLIPKFSFMGAWLVTVFSQILLLVFSLFFSRDILRFSFSFLCMFLMILSIVFIWWIASISSWVFAWNMFLDLFVRGGWLFLLFVGIFYRIVFRKKKFL